MKPKRAIFCKGCLQQLHVPIPIHGPLSIPLRIVGLRPSRMNPNICNLCERCLSTSRKVARSTFH
jgi:adenylate cyclase